MLDERNGLFDRLTKVELDEHDGKATTAKCRSRDFVSFHQAFCCGCDAHVVAAGSRRAKRGEQLLEEEFCCLDSHRIVYGQLLQSGGDLCYQPSDLVVSTRSAIERLGQTCCSLPGFELGTSLKF